MTEELISIDTSQLELAAKVLGNSAPAIQRVMRDAMKLSLQYLRTLGISIARDNDLVGVSGHYVQGFAYKMNGRGLDMTGKMYNMAGHAVFVENGRKPGKWPPDEPIRKWVVRKGLVGRFNTNGKRLTRIQVVDSITFLVRRAIGRRGTIKRFMKGGTGPAGAKVFAKTYKQGRKQVVRFFQTANARAAKAIADHISRAVGK